MGIQVKHFVCCCCGGVNHIMNSLFPVSSEAWSNRLLSIVKENNQRIDLICQFILFLLYALYIGISITMVILTHAKPVSLLSFYTTDPDDVQFSFSLALCLVLIISIIMNHLAYFDYATRKVGDADTHLKWIELVMILNGFMWMWRERKDGSEGTVSIFKILFYSQLQKKVVQDLRQRHFLVLASFSYTLRLLSIAFLIFTAYILSRRMCWHFTVPVIMYFYFMFGKRLQNETLNSGH